MKVYIAHNTHGDERAPTAAVAALQFPAKAFTIQKLLVNPRAFQANARFIDHDIQRFFGTESLAAPPSCYEHGRAKEIARELGQPYMLIDVHTTTCNMGPTVLVKKWTNLLRLLCAKLVQLGYTIVHNPDDKTCLDTLAVNGLTLEAGPAHRGADCPEVSDVLRNALTNILAFTDEILVNGETLRPDIPEVPGFRYHDTVRYPTPEWELASAVRNKDFKPLPPNTLIMFNPRTLEEYRLPFNRETLYACFIGEDSYKSEEAGWGACDLLVKDSF